MSYYYLETEIRLQIREDKVALERNLKKYAKTSILKIFLLHIVKLIISYGHISRKTAYLNIASNMFLQNKLAEGLRSIDIRVLEHPPSYLKVLQFQRYIPLGPIVNSSLGLRRIHRMIAKVGLDNFLTLDEKLMELERVLNNRVRSISTLLRRSNIEYLVLQNEHCPHEKILALAAEEINARITVIAHGYFQNFGLVTVAPIRVDELIVWTAQQRDFILRETGYDQNKVSFNGWPHKALERRSVLSDGNPLFILSDIDNYFDHDDFSRTIDILTKLVEKYKNIKIRPHPTFALSNTHRKEIILRKFGQYIQNEGLEDQLCVASFVIGHDSSVLVRAYFENIPTYCIKEISYHSIPEVPMATVNQILNIDELNSKKIPMNKTNLHKGVDNVVKRFLEKIKQQG